MATTVYSSYMGTSGGSNFLKAFLTYSTSSNDTSYTITVSSGCYVKSGWYTNAKLTNTLSWTGGSTSATVNNKNWKEGNHKMCAKTLTVSKTHSARTITFTSKLASSTDSASVSHSFTVPARAHWTVTLNNNGATSTLTKWHSEALALGTPTRAGYTFGGWWTGPNGTGTNYGTTYTANSGTTLYAKWTEIYVTQSFDANGGSFVGDAPSESIRYGNALDFSLIEHPTRTGYVFTGWSTSNAQAVGEHWGDSLTITNANAATWYACWTAEYIPPAIDADAVRAYRCLSNGNEDDSGTYGTITATFRKGQRVTYDGSTFAYTDINITKADALLDSVTGKFSTGTVNNTTKVASAKTSSGFLDVANSYQLTIRIYDSYTGTSTPAAKAVASISSAFFTMDISADGKAIAFGDVAPDTGIPDNGLMKIRTEIGLIDTSLETAVTALGWTDCII